MTGHGRQHALASSGAIAKVIYSASYHINNAPNSCWHDRRTDSGLSLYITCCSREHNLHSSQHSACSMLTEALAMSSIAHQQLLQQAAACFKAPCHTAKPRLAFISTRHAKYLIIFSPFNHCSSPGVNAAAFLLSMRACLCLIGRQLLHCTISLLR